MNDTATQSPTDVRDAMQSALLAERAMAESVRLAREAAAATLAHAAQEVARIAQRTESRVLALHSRCAQALEQRLAALGAHPPEDDSQRQAERLAATAGRVAEWLTAPENAGR